jgi:uncharacterized membrane protein YqaE (UPF0057 family)
VLPKNRKRTTVRLLIIAFFLPPAAVYLDGASWNTVWLYVMLWIFWPPLAIPPAFCYVLRSRERRNTSRPARYRLWMRHHPKTAQKVAASVAASVSNAPPVDRSEKPGSVPSPLAPSFVSTQPPKYQTVDTQETDDPFTDIEEFQRAKTPAVSYRN